MCKCESQYPAEKAVYIDDEGMHIFDSEYADYDLITINYCPFCGEKVKKVRDE